MQKEAANPAQAVAASHAGSAPYRASSIGAAQYYMDTCFHITARLS